MIKLNFEWKLELPGRTKDKDPEIARLKKVILEMRANHEVKIERLLLKIEELTLENLDSGLQTLLDTEVSPRASHGSRL